MRWCPDRKKMVALHRLVIEADIGRHLLPIEFVMHLCDNPPCVRLDHLRIGTNSDNMRDAVAKRRQHQVVKTHCPHGHPYEGDNLYVTKAGGRQCKTCTSIRFQAWTAEQKASKS
jgi:hypothetical protein